MDRKLKYNYHILQHGWNAYLRMLDIDYTISFKCPVCKDIPEILVLDGITMGTIKELPDFSQEFDEDRIFPLVPLHLRVVVPDINIRKAIKEYCLTGLSEAAFHNMVHSLKCKELCDYIMYANNVEEEVCMINCEYPNARIIIELLSKSEPITGIFPISILSENEKVAVVNLSHQDPIDRSTLFDISAKMYTFQILINSFSSVDEQLGSFFTISPIVAGFLRIFILKIETLNKYGHPRNLIRTTTANDNYIRYFPSITRHYR